MKAKIIYPKLLVAIGVVALILPNALHIDIQPVLTGCGFLCAALLLAWASSK